ncbi:UNVERIFIED_CONTAM: hypothetical protein FKN15_040836 [Acipenser sinensis]
MTAEEVKSEEEQQQAMPMEGEDLTPKKDGGLLKVIMKEGTGNETPMTGDKRKCFSKMLLVFLSPGQVIKAWDLGVATMKIGEVCRLICKPEYAYGVAGNPPKIPPNSTLVFEVELFQFKGEDLSDKEDGGIIRRILTKGEGYTKPNEGATVEVSLEGEWEGKVFDRRELTFEVGDGEGLGIPRGIEKALQSMEKGEESIIKLSPRIKTVKGRTYWMMAPSFQAKESWEMSTEEKLEQGPIVKEKGTQYFKEGKYKQAALQYKKIVSWLDHESGLSEQDEQKARALRLAAHLNLAMCFIKIQEHAQALENCSKALELDSCNEKALFRRSEALFALKEFEEARNGFQKVVQLYPDNKAAKTQITACQRFLREQYEKDKLLYANMFSKFAEHDTKKEAAEKGKDEKPENGQTEEGSMELEQNP